LTVRLRSPQGGWGVERGTRLRARLRRAGRLTEGRLTAGKVKRSKGKKVKEHPPSRKAAAGEQAKRNGEWVKRSC